MVFYVNMVTFGMVLINKCTNIVIDDERVHPLGKSPPSVVITCDEILSWKIEIWMKNHFVSDSNGNTVNL